MRKNARYYRINNYMDVTICCVFKLLLNFYVDIGTGKTSIFALYANIKEKTRDITDKYIVKFTKSYTRFPENYNA